MKKLILVGPVALVVVLATAACNNTSTPTAATVNDVTTTISGTIPAAVNGIGQTVFNPFSVGQSGGSLSLTLTSAVETLPGGTLNPAVLVGLAVGNVIGGTCVLPVGTVPAILAAGASSGVSGTEPAGIYCVQLSDVTIQTGPVAYTIVYDGP